MSNVDIVQDFSSIHLVLPTLNCRNVVNKFFANCCMQQCFLNYMENEFKTDDM